MFNTVGEITRSFEYSLKKEALLVQKVKDVCPEFRCHKLLDVGRTHWIQRIDGLEVFLEMKDTIEPLTIDHHYNLKKIIQILRTWNQLRQLFKEMWFK